MLEGFCETCCFFDGGYCKRFPPQFTGVKEVVIGYNSDNYRDITDEQDTWSFPEVDKTDWCGEYRNANG